MKLVQKQTVDPAVVVADIVATAAAAGTSAGKPDRTAGGQGTAGQLVNPNKNREVNNLPKEDAIEVMGKVVEKFKAGMFSIELDAGRTVLATMAGKLRRNRIKIMNGDKVSLELSPYDLTKGRITYRHK
jgi:translation initiation factor IF-1